MRSQFCKKGEPRLKKLKVAVGVVGLLVSLAVMAKNWSVNAHVPGSVYMDAGANFDAAAGKFWVQYNPTLSKDGSKIKSGDTVMATYDDGTSVTWTVAPAWKTTGNVIDPTKPPTITGAGGGGGGGGGGGIVGTGGAGPCVGPDCTPTPGNGDNDG